VQKLIGMKKIRFNILFRSIQGAIGKKYVVKHYGKKIVITKYPCMEYIIPSKEQRRRRNLFAEAVAWAKKVIADPVRKAAWQKNIKRKNGVYNQAIKKYLLMAKKEKIKNMSMADNLINRSLNTAFTESNKSREQPKNTQGLNLPAAPFMYSSHKDPFFPIQYQPIKLRTIPPV
jgi:hypothetical protein